jgi:hypothetical protein
MALLASMEYILQQSASVMHAELGMLYESIIVQIEMVSRTVHDVDS